jgi:hypothetical protein
MQLGAPYCHLTSIGCRLEDGCTIFSDWTVHACCAEVLRCGFRWLKTIHSKKYGVDKIVFTHHKDSVLYSSKNGWDGEKTETQSFCAPTEAIQALDQTQADCVHCVSGNKESAGCRVESIPSSLR